MHPDHAGRARDPGRPIPDLIPVFPLPNVVLFPKTYLPLHIFEPRYREMVADAAAHGHCIGMALFREGWEQGYYGNPPIHEVGCVGQLVQKQDLQDGRSNIVLHGLCRYRITQEIFEKPYRQARVALEDEDEGERMDHPLRETLWKVLETSLCNRDEAQSVRKLSTMNLPDAVLVNNLSMCLGLSPEDKQFLLESDRLPRRARRLIDLLRLRTSDWDADPC